MWFPQVPAAAWAEVTSNWIGCHSLLGLAAIHWAEIFFLLRTRLELMAISSDLQKGPGVWVMIQASVAIVGKKWPLSDIMSLLCSPTVKFFSSKYVTEILWYLAIHIQHREREHLNMTNANKEFFKWISKGHSSDRAQCGISGFDLRLAWSFPVHVCLDIPSWLHKCFHLFRYFPRAPLRRRIMFRFVSPLI